MLAWAHCSFFGLAFDVWLAFGGQAERLPPLHECRPTGPNPIQPTKSPAGRTPITGALQCRPEDAPVRARRLPMPRWPATGGRLVSELQEEARVRPATQSSPKECALSQNRYAWSSLQPPMTWPFAAALAAVEDRGWTNCHQWDVEGRQHRGRTQSRSGLISRMIILIRRFPDGDGSRIECPLDQRVGPVDLGANSKRRLRRLLNEHRKCGLN